MITKDYLNTIKEGEDLSTLINNQFNDARAKIQVLSDNFSNQVETDNTKMKSFLNRPLVSIEEGIEKMINYHRDRMAMHA